MEEKNNAKNDLFGTTKPKKSFDNFDLRRKKNKKSWIMSSKDVWHELEEAESQEKGVPWDQ